MVIDYIEQLKRNDIKQFYVDYYESHYSKKTGKHLTIEDITCSSKEEDDGRELFVRSKSVNVSSLLKSFDGNLCVNNLIFDEEFPKAWIKFMLTKFNNLYYKSYLEFYNDNLKKAKDQFDRKLIKEKLELIKEVIKEEKDNEELTK